MARLPVLLDNFAIVYNRERGTVVTTGTIDECQGLAETYNLNYQTDAYQARVWRNDG
jgi:hypothetical protein